MSTSPLLQGYSELSSGQDLWIMCFDGILHQLTPVGSGYGFEIIGYLIQGNQLSVQYVNGNEPFSQDGVSDQFPVTYTNIMFYLKIK